MAALSHVKQWGPPDRTVELLTLQNASMHAGFLGRPVEALPLALTADASELIQLDRLANLKLAGTPQRAGHDTWFD